jgi:anti-anti-sigma factor
MCEFEISKIPDGTGFKLVGELDVATTPQLTKALLEQPLQRGPVTLDLSELTFVDSSGIHAILTLASSLNGNGPLVVSNPSEAVARVFEILNLDAHAGLEIRRDTASA